MKLNTLDYDLNLKDFVINGTPLLSLLKRHEGVQPEAHISSIVAQSGTCERLLGSAKPDLQGDHVAIYLCSHCGGYDGSPIGVKLSFEGDYVKWHDIGYHFDYSEQESIPFEKVRSYLFDMAKYKSLLKQIQVCEPPAT